jgi:osmotically-inducible protein OsmY
MKSDTQLRNDIVDQLEWEPSIDAAQIGVRVKNGIVTLTGHVPQYGQKLHAERVAKSVAGVKAVADELEVRLLSTSERSDTEIASAALSAIRWHATVPEETVKVTVRDGLVTLEGTADWQYQSEAASDAVRPLVGVRGVLNLIKIKPKVTVQDIEAKIEAAFKRSALVDAKHVRVEARDGKVVLHGNVASWSERAEAERAAWSAPGVTNVENHVTVVV